MRSVSSAVVNVGAHGQSVRARALVVRRGSRFVRGARGAGCADGAGDVQLVDAGAAEDGGPGDQVVARTAHCIHALLAWMFPEGRCSSPAPSLRSRIASLTTAWWLWNLSITIDVPSRSVRNAWCQQSGHSRCSAVSVSRGATPDQAVGHRVFYLGRSCMRSQ